MKENGEFISSMHEDGFKQECIFKGPGFAETLYLGTIDGRRVIRKASNPDALPFSRTALVREINLLTNLTADIKPYFPEILGTNLENSNENDSGLPEIIYYDMPYYAPEKGWRTLSDCLLNRTIAKNEAQKIIEEITDTAFRYFGLDSRKPDELYAERTMLASIRESIEGSYDNPGFREILDMENIVLNGRRVKNIHELTDCFHDTESMRSVLTPRFDRFLHGDFFPENILYNIKTGKWLLMDPVSVRGVHRGDFVLDLNKMDDWLSGELPALRSGRFSVKIHGTNVRLDIHHKSGNLGNLYRLGIHERFREKIDDPAYRDFFWEEQGWEARWLFVKAFYCFSMLPLAEKKQAVARYFLALDTMNDFLERVDI